MAKVTIKKVPTSNTKNAPNFPEANYQYFTSNPLDFKSRAMHKNKKDPEIGTAYPTEDKGEGNAEAEKNEVIVKKDSKLFTIGGDTHKKGGTDIVMEDGDFIFSNSLKIKGDIVKSEFGLSADKEYTFADIAKKYKDMNSFHKLAESTVPLEKKTGMLMIEKYKDKLARLAFLQESQKGMPNGIPEIAAPLMEKVGSVPEEVIPEGKKFKLGGEAPRDDKNGWKITRYQGDKTNNFNAGTTSEKEWTDLANKLGFKPTSNDQKQINTEFQEFLYNHDNEYKKIIDTAHSPKDTKDPKNPNKKGQTKYGKYNEGNLGYRWDIVYKGVNDIINTRPKPVDNTGVTPEEGADGNAVEGDLGGFTSLEKSAEELNATQADYNDMGFSSPEKLALGLAMKSIPNYAPTRYQNYGLQSALGAMSNVMPYNYQSVINEANRTGSNAMRSNNAFSRTPQAMANNSFIQGQLSEQTSKIKGEEYNQNANMYNQNQGALANMMSAIGQDKAAQAQQYGDRVVQGKENLWANRRMRDKEFLAQYSNAMNNKALRNAYSVLGRSLNPNFPIVNADNATAYTASKDPFSLINGVGGKTGSKPLDTAQDIRAFVDSLKKAKLNITEDKMVELYLKRIK